MYIEIKSQTKTNNYTVEFHIAKEIRKKYEFEHELFSFNGNVIFANFAAVRSFTQKLNSKRPITNQVKVSEVNAAGLIDEIYHFLIREYEKSTNKGVFQKAINFLTDKLGEENLNKIVFEFLELFPPIEVYKGKMSILDYLNGYHEDKSNLEITIEEILLLYFANFNPANKNIKELFDENYFSNKELYSQTINSLDTFFEREEKFGPDGLDLIKFLKAPIINNPDNIEAQLDFIMKKWGVLLTEKFTRKILTSYDLVKEDYVHESFGGGGGTGAPSVAPVYKGKADLSDILVLGKSAYRYAEDAAHDYDEPEQFTPDVNWMPNVVLIAKNSYVWLDQLSKQYGREIKRLDQIPDEELDRLAKANFNGLWLIGLWERSSASKKIKHMMGNTDAVASAYSLFDYQVADDLGGEEAYQDLNRRAKARGIRLASDMVPNHTGIFSKWVLEKPEYFIQSDYPPFPNYRFTGENLSEDPNVEIRIEDGYWSHSDAAVVFQRIDKINGSVKYFYHGNDGTNMPWNDTAQLNLLKQEVREAVIQMIFKVARRFSIIRFDAAMTLTKRHFSRLWFPQPGKGGDIPSRADYALTKDEFDTLFPVEFWREVVDRINSEMPETLLLAEAFWLMEGYFVRSLGMHRVYNSAFMHMMMKEENEKYRDLITNTLEFEPEILKRYVNFMSNPDEETSIKQFGIDDKYFGVCIMMLTLPGLPMFAHGQIEGYTEKYGMEYQRAYYNEFPNQWLVERHEREVFPVAKKRYLFSEIKNFWFFDYYDLSGKLNEDVFAFSNSVGNERALVFYNNKFQTVKGKIKFSAPKLVSKENEEKRLRAVSFAESLEIKYDEKYYYIMKEHVTNLEYIYSGIELHENGFNIELDAFKYRLYWNFKEVYDADGTFYDIYKELNGRGVLSINDSIKQKLFAEIHESFTNLFKENVVSSLLSELSDKELEDELEVANNKIGVYLNTVKTHFKVEKSILGAEKLYGDFLTKVNSASKFINEKRDKFVENRNPLPDNLFLLSPFKNYKENSLLLNIYYILVLSNDYLDQTVHSDIFNKLYISKHVEKILRKYGKGDFVVGNELLLLRVLLENFEKNHIIFKEINKEKILKHLLDLIKDELVQKYLGVNEYKSVIYFSKENLEELLDWLYSIHFLQFKDVSNKSFQNDVIELTNVYSELLELSKKSGYKLDKLLESIELETEKSNLSEVKAKQVSKKKNVVKNSKKVKTTEVKKKTVKKTKSVKGKKKKD